MRCWAYVDGFNLYKGMMERKDADCSGCRWLNLMALCQMLRPDDTVERIKYFTALVERRTEDPDQPVRQRIYWRALATLPDLERIEGRFARWPKWAPLAESVDMLQQLESNGVNVAGVRPLMRRIYRSEEKGTDVNLAAHLVHDANQSAGPRTFETAIIISSDSDLSEAIRLVRKDTRKPVHVYKPNPAARTSQLKQCATSVRDIPAAALTQSLFPAALHDARGPFSQPPSW